MHVVQIIPRPGQAREVSLVPGELQPLGVLVEGGRFFAEGVVGVIARRVAGGSRDEARGAQMVEVVVAPAGRRFGGEEQAVAVDGVGVEAPAAVVVQGVAGLCRSGPGGSSARRSG